MNSTTPTERPIILITNDDGIAAPGIRNLLEAVQDLGDIYVVAPDSPQSGMGHAITISRPLRLNQVQIFGEIPAYQCTGTPVDCVKLAVDKVLHRRPDICLSGINHGANHSINIIYSGTMSAAMEAAIEGINSAGFSLLDYNFDADFTLARKVVREVALKLLSMERGQGVLFNVNIPRIAEKDSKGLKICRQANAKWQENFDERLDPMGKKYYWLTGEFQNRDHGEDTDVWALANGYSSVVPVQYDLTHHALKAQLEKEWQP